MGAKREYVSFFRKFHDFVEGDVGVIAAHGIAFSVSDVVVGCYENADGVY